MCSFIYQVTLNVQTDSSSKLLAYVEWRRHLYDICRIYGHWDISKHSSFRVFGILNFRSVAIPSTKTFSTNHSGNHLDEDVYFFRSARELSWSEFLTNFCWRIFSKILLTFIYFQKNSLMYLSPLYNKTIIHFSYNCLNILTPHL